MIAVTTEGGELGPDGKPSCAIDPIVAGRWPERRPGSRHWRAGVGMAEILLAFCPLALLKIADYTFYRL